jgi:hypothetical protein
MNDLLKNIIKQFIPFAQKHIGFKDPPRLFLRNDAENAKNPFGKTAFYDPNEKSVTLYITGRHPKDVLRSLGHELVHHKQNCAGQFSDSDDMGEGYAQRDPHLRQMEIEANRDGSMCLRDFEDKLKKENTIYYEHLQKGDNKMSTKDWKNKELTTLLSEAWGFKFNSLQEFEEFDGAGEIQAESEEDSLEEAEEELEEQSKTDAADRGAGRAAGGRRLDEEEEELEEAGSFTTNMPDDVPSTADVMQKMRDDGTAPEEKPPYSAEDEPEAPGKAKLDAILQNLPVDALQDPKIRDMILNAVDKVMRATDPLEEGEDEELDEAAKPDYIDIDGDGDKEESMKDAAKDKKEKKEKNESVDTLKEAIANLLRNKLKG